MPSGTVWTPEEDDLLRQLVEEYGPKRWALIATKLPDKHSKQCRRRWKNFLSLEQKKGVWSPEEDEVLLQGHVRFGNKWTEIARLVGGRTDNAVKNRFIALTRKIARHTGGGPPTMSPLDAAGSGLPPLRASDGMSPYSSGSPGGSLLGVKKRSMKPEGGLGQQRSLLGLGGMGALPSLLPGFDTSSLQLPPLDLAGMPMLMHGAPMGLAPGLGMAPLNMPPLPPLPGQGAGAGGVQAGIITLRKGLHGGLEFRVPKSALTAQELLYAREINAMGLAMRVALVDGAGGPAGTDDQQQLQQRGGGKAAGQEDAQRDSASSLDRGAAPGAPGATHEGHHALLAKFLSAGVAAGADVMALVDAYNAHESAAATGSSVGGSSGGGGGSFAVGSGGGHQHQHMQQQQHHHHHHVGSPVTSSMMGQGGAASAFAPGPSMLGMGSGLAGSLAAGPIGGASLSGSNFGGGGSAYGAAGFDLGPGGYAALQGSGSMHGSSLLGPAHAGQHHGLLPSVPPLNVLGGPSSAHSLPLPPQQHHQQQAHQHGAAPPGHAASLPLPGGGLRPALPALEPGGSSGLLGGMDASMLGSPAQADVLALMDALGSCGDLALLGMQAEQQQAGAGAQAGAAGPMGLPLGGPQGLSGLSPSPSSSLTGSPVGLPPGLAQHAGGQHAPSLLGLQAPAPLAPPSLQAPQSPFAAQHLGGGGAGSLRQQVLQQQAQQAAMGGLGLPGSGGGLLGAQHAALSSAMSGSAASTASMGASPATTPPMGAGHA